MKKIKINGTIIAVLILVFSFKQINKSDFSGTWAINMTKSQFGDAPAYTASKQIKVMQSNDNIQLENTIIGDDKDSTAKVTIPFDNKGMTMIDGEGHKRVIKIDWLSGDEVLNIVSSVRFAGDTSREEYQSSERWSLSEIGKVLTIKKKVSAYSGFEYSITAVYDKK